jgi:hypothetical protein
MYHALPAFAQMRDEGVLTDQDLMVLHAFESAEDQARQQGIFIKSPDSSYQFAEGVGPFDPRWQDIMFPMFDYSEPISPLSWRDFPQAV